MNAPKSTLTDQGFPAPPATLREEAGSLKELLAQERAATLEVRSAKLSAQKKLADAEADFGKSERAEKDLDHAPVLRERNFARIEAQLAQPDDASRVSQQARSLELQSHKRHAGVQTVVAIAATILIGATLFGVVRYLHDGKPGDVSATSVQRPAKKSVARLSRAFSRFPGTDPETIMRSVNEKSSSGLNRCAFAWNNGQPAFQFGDGHRGNTSIEATLTQCAEAVERLR